MSKSPKHLKRAVYASVIPIVVKGDIVSYRSTWIRYQATVFFYIIGRIKQTNVRIRVNVYYRLRLAVLLTIKYFTAIKRLVIILLIILIKRRHAKMWDFNALTEHTLLLYFSGKTIKILVILIISRSLIDKLVRFFITRGKRSPFWCCLWKSY